MGARNLKRRFDNLDAADSIHLNRELEHVKAKTYDKKFPNLRAREFIPIDNSIDNATETITWYGYTQVGVAQLLASYADDLPRADVRGEKQSTSVFGLGASYGYNLQEVRASAKARSNLPDKKAGAARRAVEILIDKILAVGDSAAGLYGLLNQPNALAYTVAAGVSTATEWATKTPQEIVADMVGICEYIATTTNEVEKPNTLLLPRTQFVLISTTRFSDSSDKTILDWFKSVYPGIMVESWLRLDGAGEAGSDRMVAYSRDSDLLEGVIPQEFEQLDVEQRGLEFVVPCHARIGGVIAYYPLSIAYGDGI